MKLFVHGLFACGTLLACVNFTGCSSPTGQVDEVLFSSDQQSQTPGAPTPTVDVARFRVGDTVVVSFSGAPDTIPDHEEAIKEDGNITLDLIGKIHALGKTTGELQNEIQADLVPEFYRRLTVTVKSTSDRVYYVGGQVAAPGPKEYLGETTVTKAIQASGDFNDFASHKVWLNRANGQRIQVDCDKALKNPSLDPPVYPGDQIVVEKSIW
jgi:protein involved in polysaccharide export with SLBB domain